MTKPKTVTKPKPPEAKPTEAAYITNDDKEALGFCVTSTIKENVTNREVTVKIATWEGEFMKKLASLNLEIIEYRKLKEKLEKEKKK